MEKLVDIVYYLHQELQMAFAGVDGGSCLFCVSCKVLVLEMLYAKHLTALSLLQFVQIRIQCLRRVN